METWGKKLYTFWQQGMAEQGIECDPWEALSQSEQAAWEFTAEMWEAER